MANGDDEKKQPPAPGGFRDLDPEENRQWSVRGHAPTAAEMQEKAQAESQPTSWGERLGEAAARTHGGAGLMAEHEHPEWDLAKAGYRDIKGGEYQKGLHELFRGGLEFLRPTAPLMGAGGVLPMVRGVAMTAGGEQIGEHLGPHVGLTPELGGDIGGTAGALLGIKRARGGAARPAPAPRATGPTDMGPVEVIPPKQLPAPRLAQTVPTAAERMHDIGNIIEAGMEGKEPPPSPAPVAPRRPRPGPPAGPARLTAGQQLDAAARETFGVEKYEDLNAEQKRVAASRMGGPTGEKRVVRGESPTGMERRAEEMPKPTIGPQGGAAAFTIETDPKMGIRWAKTPGLPDISIPSRLTDPTEIQRYVAEKQALQREGMATLPKTTIGAPGPPAAQPAAPGTLPQAAPDAIERQAEAQVEKMRGSAYPKTGAFEDFNQRNRARINEAIEQERAGTLPPVTTGPPAAPAPTTLGRPASVPKPAAPGTEVPAASLDEILRRATGQPEPPQPGVPLSEQIKKK